MPVQLQMRRGTKALNDAFTGSDGEITVNTDSKSLRSHDGAKAGGYELGMAQANGMADLRTHTPAIGATRYLLQHTTTGDGGHGVFRAVIGGYTAAQDNNGTVIVVGVNAWVREDIGYITPEMFGAINTGDGLTPDAITTLALDSACQYLNSRNGGSLRLNGKYNIGRAQTANQRGIYLRKNIAVEGAGSTLYMTDNASIFSVNPSSISVMDITANIVAGATTFTVASTLSTIVGDVVLMKLAPSIYDAFEPMHWYYTTVISVTATTITVDTKAPVSVTTAVAPIFRQIIKTSPCENISFNNLYFACIVPVIQGQIESAIQVRHCQNISVTNCYGTNVGAGILTTQYTKNILALNLMLKGSRIETPSKGRLLSIAESENVTINGMYIEKSFSTSPIVIESSCKNVTLDNIKLIGYASHVLTGNQAAVTLLGQTPVLIGSIETSGDNTSALITNVDRGIHFARRFSMTNSLSLGRTDYPNVNLESFSLNGIEYFDKGIITVKIAIVAGTAQTFALPSGLLKSSEILVPTSIVGISQIFLRRDASFTNNGLNLVPAAPNVVKKNNYSLDVGGLANGLNFNSNKQLLITTTAAAIAPFVYLRLVILQDDRFANTNGDSLMNHISA